MNGYAQYDRALMLATGAHAENPADFGGLASVTQDFATALQIFAEELYSSEADVCSISNRMRALSEEVDHYSQELRDEARLKKGEAQS